MIQKPDRYSDADRPESGVVIGFGPEAGEIAGDRNRVFVPLYTRGTRLAFPQHAGYELKVDGETVVLLWPSEILGVQIDAAE